MSRPLLQRLIPNPRFYGWVIVALSFLASALSSPGQSFAISLYIEHVIASMDVTRLEVSSLYGGMTLLAALCLPYLGSLADRTSARRFLTLNIVLLAGAVALFGAADNLLMLGVAFFSLRLLGQGAISLGTLTAIVLWFKRYRGRALAMSSLGYAFGELVFPATIVGLIGLAGWRGSLWIFATVYLVLFAPLFAAGLREREEDEPLDGGEVEEESERTSLDLPEVDFDVRSALRTPVLWGMLLAVAVLPMVVTALVFHQVALFEATGWGLEYVPISFVFFALSGVTTTYAAGIVLERIPSRYGLGAGMIAAALATVVAAFMSAPGASLLYGALLGGASGVVSAANNLMWPEYYGIRALGAIKGIVNAARNGATALGPPLVALLMGPSADFSSALTVLGVLCLTASVAAPLLRPPRLETR